MSVHFDSGNLINPLHRHIEVTSLKLNESMERLTTGLKMNKASDDAANLGLVKSFDAHISNARAYQRNAQDAMNLLNIAESDMSEIQENLQRMRTLAIKGMNDVYSANELAALKNEVDQIALEIEQITKSSSFSGMKLLDGSVSALTIQVADDYIISSSNIDLTAILDELDFVDVLTEKEDLYFLNMASGGTYYAEFDDRLYEITNSSSDTRNLIYRYEENLGDLDSSIEFIQDNLGVSAAMYGEYENDHVQLGSGEMAVNVPAGSSTNVRVGNRVFSLTNTSGVDNTAVFETPGTAINVLSGVGISGSFEYTTSSYTTLSAGRYALDFNAGETKHIEFSGNLYELQNTSGASQTLVFDSTAGLTEVAGGTDINVSNLGSMTAETVLGGSEKYMELAGSETQYFEDGGTIYRVSNNTTAPQTVILNASNNILNTTGTASIAAMPSASNGDVSAMANPNTLQVQSGQTYYLKSSDNTTLHTLTATQSGVALIDFDGDNVVGLDGANLNHNTITGTSFSDVTPDGLQQFTVNLGANSVESVTIGNEIYQLDNTGNGAQSVTYQYSSGAKTVVDISAGGTVGNFIDTLDTLNAIGANDVFVENLGAGATTFLEVGSDIFQVTNTGATQGFTFSYNAGAHTLTPSIAGSVVSSAVNSGAVSSVDAGDIKLDLAVGQTQHVTVGGDTFSVENNLGTNQSVLLSYSAGNLNIDSGSALNITNHNDMDVPTSVDSSNFYIDLNAGQTKYITRGNELFEITNTTGDSKIAVFSQSGNVLNPIETSGVNVTSRGSETAEYVTNANDYYIELDANETKWVNINGSAFELTNSTGSAQTELLRTIGTNVVNELNSNVSQTNIPLSNLDDYDQLLVKVDWAMRTLEERRTELGSKSQALESVIDRNEIRENSLVASNSLLRDADIAYESAQVAKNQVLQQASASLFTQVNKLSGDMALTILSTF